MLNEDIAEALEAGEIVSIEVMTGIQPKSRPGGSLGGREYASALT